MWARNEFLHTKPLRFRSAAIVETSGCMIQPELQQTDNPQGSDSGWYACDMLLPGVEERVGSHWWEEPRTYNHTRVSMSLLFWTKWKCELVWTRNWCLWCVLFLWTLTMTVWRRRIWSWGLSPGPSPATTDSPRHTTLNLSSVSLCSVPCACTCIIFIYASNICIIIAYYVFYYHCTRDNGPFLPKTLAYSWHTEHQLIFGVSQAWVPFFWKMLGVWKPWALVSKPRSWWNWEGFKCGGICFSLAILSFKQPPVFKYRTSVMYSRLSLINMNGFF